MTKTLAFPAPEPEGHPYSVDGHDPLIEPHGGHLVDLIAAPARAAELKAASRDWPSWDLTPRQLCDLELLLDGSFSPLTGFLGRADHDAVCRRMRLAGAVPGGTAQARSPSPSTSRASWPTR